ncbi:MAG: PASTA domain-containing protein [Sedimentisphaerales bacterium]|nr:PASTA domain-containing protein [Sedimentisphaerales bacterium]
MRWSEGCLGDVVLFALAAALAFCAAANGVGFAGGTGEPNDPYQIATVEQLLSINTTPDLPRKHYVLVASLDMSGRMFTDSLFWSLHGSLDGNGYTIRNLRIEGEGMSSLIDHIWDGAEVRNLGLVNVQIIGGSFAGALARTNSGRVVNCYSTGAVISTMGPAAGGLVGGNWGTITDCYSTATVIAGGAGGLVGQNLGRISRCYATGEVTGGHWVGGLAGSNHGEITESYSLATVAGELMFVGGLVGYNAGKISACYAGATVVGQDRFVGGLAGDNSGSVSSCYATGSVTGVDFVGGLVGESSDKISACYAVATVVADGRYVGALVGSLGPGKKAEDIVTSSYFLDPNDGGGPDNEIGLPLTKAEMLRQASFVGFDFWGTVDDGAADAWYMPKTAYPVLAWQVGATGLEPVPDISGLSLADAVEVLEAAGFVAGEVRYDFHRTILAGYVIHADPYWIAAPGAVIDLVVSIEGEYDWADNPGDGTAAHPYQIATAGQLESLGDHPELWTRQFVLTADIDLVGRTYPTALIAPDADRSKSGFQGPSFNGTLDGQGHAIDNLTIHHVDTRYDFVGLFGMIGASGRVENLKLMDADVEGGSGSSSSVGLLAGTNAGTVEDCSASGVVRGGKGDGLVGANTGALIDCRSDVTRI